MQGNKRCSDGRAGLERQLVSGQQQVYELDSSLGSLKEVVHLCHIAQVVPVEFDLQSSRARSSSRLKGFRRGRAVARLNPILSGISATHPGLRFRLDVAREHSIRPRLGASSRFEHTTGICLVLKVIETPCHSS